MLLFEVSICVYLPIMRAFLFLFTFVATVLSVGNGTVLVASDHLIPHCPVGGLSDSHVLRGLITRQGCVDVGYTQCPGYTACCPAGGACCSMLSLASYALGWYTYCVDSFPSPEQRPVPSRFVFPFGHLTPQVPLTYHFLGCCSAGLVLSRLFFHSHQMRIFHNTGRSVRTQSVAHSDAARLA
jgi:hypothetical protein